MFAFLKKACCVVLSASLILALASCGEEAKKKKKVIKKIIVQEETDDSNVINNASEDNSSDDNAIDDVYVPVINTSNTYENTDDGYKSDRTVVKKNNNTTEEVGQITPSDIKYSSWAGPTGYTIVYKKGDKDASLCADLLKSYFSKNYKAELSVKDDSSSATSKEILVGNTNRTKATLKENEYSVSVSDKKLVFSAGSGLMLKSCVQNFIKAEIKSGKAAVFSRKTDFSSTALNDYKYVWGDEFEGTSLDKKLWCLTSSMPATAEMAITTDETNINVKNGNLNLLATRYWNPKIGGAEFVCPYSVSTSDTMSYKYGYLEMRAKVPFMRGVWPSLWTSSNGVLGPKTLFDYTIEVDVFEIFASTDTVVSNIHKWYDNGDHTQWSAVKSDRDYVFDSENLNNEFHIYGFKWTPTEATMYVDGNAYTTFDLTQNFDDGASGMGGFDTQLCLILNNHLFTNSSPYKPYPDCEIYVGDLPAIYEIDYIRLYQKDDEISKMYTAQ